MGSNLIFFPFVLVTNVEIEVELDEADDAIFVLALPVCVVSVVITVILIALLEFVSSIHNTFWYTIATLTTPRFNHTHLHLHTFFN
jgi:hypothetical protein